MDFNPYEYPAASRRVVTYASNGMVATSQPLAAGAGLRILQQGGNAIDAAIATAAALTVLEPCSNGIGSDNFAIVWSGGQLTGLNSSGPAPNLLSIDAMTRAGYKEMPQIGWPTVTVPGAPAGWAALSEHFGRLPFAALFEPAIDYATRGFPVSPYLRKSWHRYYQRYRHDFQAEEFSHWLRTWAPGGAVPQVGDLFQLPNHAATLSAIAESSARAFYEGDVAERIDQFSRQTGGFIRKDDLVSYRPEWVEPVSMDYRGYTVWELPPNSQGIIALMALNILGGFDLRGRPSVEQLHVQIEAMKLAFIDGLHYITDPAHMSVSVKDLLSAGYGADRRKLITDKALMPAPGHPVASDTVYLCTADDEGNMVSLIQSNAMSFGSGIMVPGTGVALQNRGSYFSLDAAHANSLEPGKRPYHTIVPAFLTRDGKPIGPFGVMGGYMQPQGHLQVVTGMIDEQLNPQAALDKPRWKWNEGLSVEVEQSLPTHLVDGLIDRGHRITIQPHTELFGKGQVIWRLDNGVLAGGTEPRSDGGIAAW